MRSNETLLARKLANYARQEQAIFDSLCALFPQPKRRKALRLVAMMSIGAMRVAIDNWSQDGGKRPMPKYLREAFAGLKETI